MRVCMKKDLTLRLQALTLMLLKSRKPAIGAG